VADEPIVVVQYDPEWPRSFEAERALLERVLAPWLEGGIHHMGSTAIPGIAAKPVIDMMAGVHDLEEARAAFEPLREQGYHSAPHRPDVAHHFAKPSLRPSESSFGLHLTEPESALWRERLAFRDALRADPMLAAEYEALKPGSLRNIARAAWRIRQGPSDRSWPASWRTRGFSCGRCEPSLRTERWLGESLIRSLMWVA
jgi:GrpB-like predicted nucleotidyltransferase (UPF0157 family)